MPSDKLNPVRFVDKYAFNARIVPALIVLLPIGLSLATLFPNKFARWDIIVWLGTSAGLAVFLEQLARDRGKRKEPGLYKLWGGKPSTRMLRHRDSTLSVPTLARYHERLTRLIPISMPTPEEEKSNSDRADAIYDSCGDFLRARSRDKEKFPLVFEENVNYGFRRNLWGMKPVAVILNILSMLLVFTQIHPYCTELTSAKPVAWVAMILNISFLMIWFFVIKPDWVKTAAEAYAIQLLSTVDVLESANQPKPS